MKTVFRLFDNGERHARRGSRREMDGEKEWEGEGGEGGKKKVARRSNFHQGKCRFHRVVRVTSNLRVTWNRFPDAMSVARSLHEQTRGRGKGRGDARTDAFNFRVIDERSTPFKRAENHGLEICRDPEIRG